MQLIEYIYPPTKINIIWQKPDADGISSGDRFLIGHITIEGNKSTLQYYDSEEVKRATEKGFVGLTAFPYEKAKIWHGDIIEVLSRRLPPKTRGDFEEYLRSYGLSEKLKDEITIAELLAYTNGKVAGDGFSFFHSFENVQIPFEFSFEIAGFRYSEGMVIQDKKSLVGEKVFFEPEKINNFDQEAIKVLTEQDGKKIMLGYIPKGLNCVLHNYLEANKNESIIVKVNGSVEKPSVFVITKVI